MEAPRDLLPCCQMSWPNDCDMCNAHNTNVAPGPSAPPAVTAVPTAMDADASGDDLAELHAALDLDFDNDEAPPLLLQALDAENIDEVLAYYEQWSEDEDCCDGAKKAKLSEKEEGACADKAEPNETEAGECSPSDNIQLSSPFTVNELREAEGPSPSAAAVPTSAPASLPASSPPAPPAAATATPAATPVAPKGTRKRQARKPAVKRETPVPAPSPVKTKVKVKKEVPEEDPKPAAAKRSSSKKKELTEEQLMKKRERQKIYSQKNRVKVNSERRTNKQIIEDKDREIEGLKDQLEKLTLENTTLRASLDRVTGENVQLREVLFAPAKAKI